MYNIKPITGLEESISKALMPIQGSDFFLENSTALIERKEVAPMLLTALLGGVSQTDFFNTNTFKYDEMDHGNALPKGKSFTEHGGRVAKDKPRVRRWGIGSFGISGDVAPQDYIGRRKAGTNDFLTEADVLVGLQEKMRGAWGLFDEQQYVNLLTTDTNLVAGGPAEEYNFYDEIVGGGARAEASIDFSDVNADPMAQIRAQKQILNEEAIKSGEINTRYVVIAGDTFFNAALDEERNSELARPLKTTFDFASQEVTSSNIDGSGFMVDNFDSSLAGVTIINYTANIGGITIDPTKAYMIPVQATNFIRKGFAPAQTREYANTIALPKYSWSGVSDRQGVVTAEESNFLMAMTNPRLLRPMVAA